jgi:serine/threonine protein kinase
VNNSKIKKLSRFANKNSLDLIENEIQIMNVLNHPNIVKCYEIIDDQKNQNTYFILEYMRKGTLGNFLTQEKSTNFQKIWNFFRDLLLGLEYCHEKAKIIHLDIKPENLLIDELNRLKITDFGISYKFKDDDTIKPKNKGTPYFRAPEMTFDKPFKGRSSDIWAAGVTLYYSIYKKYPFFVKDHYQTHILINKIRNDE